MNENHQVVISISSLENEIHQLINQQRQKHGLILLSFDVNLAKIARKHSQDMLTRNFFSHQNPEGQTPTDGGKIVGFNCHKNYGSYYTEGIPENIFKSHLYNSITYYNGVPDYNWMSQKEIAQSAVNGWMNSPGHRKNILTKTYDIEGIGVAVSKETQEVYITQNFC